MSIGRSVGKEAVGHDDAEGSVGQEPVCCDSDRREGFRVLGLVDPLEESALVLCGLSFDEILHGHPSQLSFSPATLSLATRHSAQLPLR